MNRPVLRFYVDSSVIGGCLDLEFAVLSDNLFRLFRDQKARLVISEITLRELEEAPAKVRNILDSVPLDVIEILPLPSEAANLAMEYLTQGALPTKSLADVQHIALATIAKVDILVSWNFKHIVNIDRIRLYNSINMKLGYATVEIRSPREVQREDDEEEGGTEDTKTL